jgi:hypothetical protein
MKKYSAFTLTVFLTIIFLFLSGFKLLRAQTKNSFLTEMNISVYSSDYEKSKAKLNQFIKQINAKITNQNETERQFNIDLYLKETGFYMIDSLISGLGYVLNKEINTFNNDENINKIKLELAYLENKKQAYENISKEMTDKDERFYNYWEQIRAVDKQIFELNLNLQGYNENHAYKVKISLFDDTQDFSSDKVSWANMPGASFDMLFVESPVKGISASQYYGYSLKYMFTKGKSYMNLGALKHKSEVNKSDTSTISEIFMFGFGQDYYTRHFGRGKRKFLNLYTGYNIGGAFITSDTRKKLIAYMQPVFGIELFKNKYILLDNRIGYFVPFYENRNLRGFNYSISFNFVF